MSKTQSKKKEITKVKIAEAEYIIPLETALDEITAYQPKKTFSAKRKTTRLGGFLHIERGSPLLY